jgi:CheY-like chemotaxis protein
MRDLGCEHILLVEDEPDILAVLGDMFEEEGIRTSRASTAEQALALLRGGLRPDLVLADLGLPGMTGDELLAVLDQDEAWRDIPVAVMTGDRAGFEELRRIGADEVLHKPFSLERLNEVMARLCARRSTGT